MINRFRSGSLAILIFSAAMVSTVLAAEPTSATSQDTAPPASDPIAEAEITQWHGFRRLDFPFDGRACTVIEPKRTATGKPWIWRARFFGHEPQTDLALLERGFHVAYVDVAGLFGCPKAVGHWNRFYELLVQRYGFASRPALEGMSRGGLIALNWAADNPRRVACLYLDAPVCDFRSWPGGKGRSQGSSRDWEICKKVYGLSEQEALKYPGNPVDRLKRLAEAEVPMLLVCGMADEVVPFEENGAIVRARYRALDGPIRVIEKPGVGHHPHSLEDPKPIVDFVLKHTKAGNAD
jgi:pimeloyl-ACP methyl ester carboxylesterase